MPKKITVEFTKTQVDYLFNVVHGVATHCWENDDPRGAALFERCIEAMEDGVYAAKNPKHKRGYGSLTPARRCLP